LGDVYPASWYEHLESEIRDVFQKLTEITQEDLNAIQVLLESHDVIVRRPCYQDIENHVIDNGMLLKPEITPRDNYVVIGNTLHVPTQQMPQWQHAVDQYTKDTRVSITPRSVSFINGANVVRAGKDIVVDTDKFEWTYQNQWPDYRVQLEKNGGHMDGCFAILKPGLILANRYYNGYDRNFPGWEIIYLDNPTFRAHASTGYKQPYPVWNGKFWDTTVGTNKMFNDHIIKHAQDWVGNYTETYFELNCLSIDESNVIMLAENEPLAKTLQGHGITVHWVPFRTRSFWDGAMHCLTVDIRRQSSIEDFFPERG
jgi:sRNA-binding regulator protein Hfq